jgi:hypothetical protein
MRVSLNTFIKVIVISTFIYILSWNFLSLKEGLSLSLKEGLSDDGAFDETTETIDSKTGQKREMTEKEAKDAKKKRAEEKSSSKDIDERIKYYNKTEAAS